MNTLFSEENKVRRTLFEARKVVRVRPIKMKCVVLLGQFVYLVYSVMKTKTDCLLCVVVPNK